MCFLALWLWVCFAGGIGLLVSGDEVTGAVAVCAGLVTLAYMATPSQGARWLIRAGLVVLWFLGGLLLWNWEVEDWALAARVAFGVLGGAALLAYLIRRLIRGDPA